MIVIVGAGPAGLSAAYHLQKDYILLEKEASVGGLCRSFELAGTTFDLGGHAFFTKHAYVRDLLTRLSEVELFTQTRQAWVYSHGRYVPYPFQGHLFSLPTEVVKECLVGLLRAGTERTDAPPSDLQDWIIRSFGDGIARHFLAPYNEKVWAHPLSEIVPTWAANRIVTPDVEAIVAGALEPVPFRAFDNASVTYPASGGFFNLYKSFLPIVEPHLRRKRVATIDLARHCVLTDDGDELEYDYLVSTMPLTELVENARGMPDECRRAAEQLRHNSLHLVNLVFDRPKISEMQRVYVADPGIPFHKLVLNSNSSPSLRAAPCFGIQAEVSFSSHKPVDPNGLRDRVLEANRQMGIVREGERPIAVSVVTLPLAYPVYTRMWASAREVIFEHLRRHGVYCAGRFGEWLYINSDEAVMRGKHAADLIRKRLPMRSSSVQRWQREGSASL